MVTYWWSASKTRATLYAGSRVSDEILEGLQEFVLATSVDITPDELALELRGLRESRRFLVRTGGAVGGFGVRSC